MKYKIHLLLLLVLASSFLIVSNTFGFVGYEIQITTMGNGTVTKNPDSTYYNSVNVTLTAVPDKGWKFVRWEGDVTGSTNPGSVYVDSTKYVTATFEKMSNTTSNLLLLDE